MKAEAGALHGWVVLDKPKGVTSAAAVAKVRRLLGGVKAGHAGTLDPLATGVLPIGLGEATKTVGFAQDGVKQYRFVIAWGEERASDDSEGPVLAVSDSRPAREEIVAALDEFTGLISQVPPRFSAIKVAGERAYKLARQGRPAELDPRPVQIDSFQLLDTELGPDHHEFRVHCGKGAYIRSLARDLGRKLGALGHVAELRRIQVGPFTETGAFSLDKLAQLWQEMPSSEWLLPVETVLADIPALVVTGPQADRLRQGQPIRVLNAADGTACVMNAGRLIALTQVVGGEVRPARVFNL